MRTESFCRDVAPLQPTDELLLSSIMQTLGALWGIVFVVYVFLANYMEGWRTIAHRVVGQTEIDMENLQRERQVPRATGVPLSMPSRLSYDVKELEPAREAYVWHLRVFRRILWSSVPVAASVLIDVWVFLTNDAAYVGLAVAVFILAFLSVAIILSYEVWTSVRYARDMIRDIDKSAASARKAIEQAEKDASFPK